MIGSKVLKVATLTWCVSIIAACGVKASVDQDTIDVQKTEQKIVSQPDEMPVGSELKLCDDCPTFVKVPSAPDNLRNIQYVSKYELTWNNYLAAVDEGVCPIPNYPAGGYEHYEGDVADYLEAFRVDWPIADLNLTKIKCYMEWLNIKSGRQFALPTADEWKWFARAGEAGIKFPWGDNPEDGNAAFATNKRIEPKRYDYNGKSLIELAERLGVPTYQISRVRARHIVGVKVGQYSPNNWGLYDLMGNYQELTSDCKKSILRKGRCIYTVMGTNFYDHNWKKKGIDIIQNVTATELGFFSRVGSRFIIISEDE